MATTAYSTDTESNDLAVSAHPPKWRLHLMRALFFLNFISLAFDNWSTIFFPKEQLDTFTGVTISFWAAFSLVNLVGVRFPLKMIPILVLQLLYKTAWIIGVYIPAKKNGLLNDSLESFLWVCIAGIVLNLFVLPWGYSYRYYLKGFFRLRRP